MRAVFVMIKCEMGAAYKVAQQAADTIEEMSELYSISGRYDLLGKFYLPPDRDIGLFVTEKIQVLSGVRDTHTLITFNAFTAGAAG
jgi:DNA-binding Lrp family transcriptional regulator